MKRIKYLALGDSYTIGEGVDEMGSFPHQLMDSWCDKESISGDVKLVAVTGWSTTDLLNAIEKADVINIEWDVVTLLIGVNNQYQSKPARLYEKEFAALIDKAIAFAKGNPAKVIAISIPDYGVTPFAVNKNPIKIREEIDSYNDVATHVSINLGCSFVNVTDISEKAGMDNTLITTDGLHPSAKQYGLWVNRILPHFEKALMNE